MELVIQDDDVVMKALYFAYNAHRNQKRKGDGAPYYVHCFDVVSILLKNNAPKHVVAAGALHDTIEDVKYTGITQEMILNEFGPDITELVMDVTEENKDMSWKERKTKSIEKLMNSTRNHQMLKCADKVSNGRDTLLQYRLKGDDCWKVFKAGKEDQAFYYYGVFKQLNKIKDLPMYEEYRDIIVELFGRH